MIQTIGSMSFWGKWTDDTTGPAVKFVRMTQGKNLLLLPFLLRGRARTHTHILCSSIWNIKRKRYVVMCCMYCLHCTALHNFSGHAGLSCTAYYAAVIWKSLCLDICLVSAPLWSFRMFTLSEIFRLYCFLWLQHFIKWKYCWCLVHHFKPSSPKFNLTHEVYLETLGSQLKF